MKVLLINNRHFVNGGSETVYFNTATLLRKAGHEVVFFSFRDERNVPCKQESYFAEKGGKIAQICNYFYNKDAARKLEELLLAERPDVAHIHLLWGAMSPSILVMLKQYGVPVVHTAHDYRMVCPAYLFIDGKGQQCERCKGGNFYQCALHKCSKGSVVESLLMTLEMYNRNRKYHPVDLIDGFIFVSNFSRRKHIEFDYKFLSARTEVLYNCPNEDVKDSLNENNDTFDSYYMFYGRLSVEKGLPTLIKAFEKYPHLRLKIVGTGPLEEELKTYCSERNLLNVEFLGYKFGKELFDLVARAKFVCVPSECFENNPMTIVEAYSLCAPVIGAAIGGISEVVEDGKTGFLFKSGDIDSLREALKKCLAVSGEEYVGMKRNAVKFAKEHFNRKTYAQRLENFYSEVIHNYNKDRQKRQRFQQQKACMFDIL